MNTFSDADLPFCKGKDAHLETLYEPGLLRSAPLSGCTALWVNGPVDSTPSVAALGSYIFWLCP